jgi:hypothetical protein
MIELEVIVEARHCVLSARFGTLPSCNSFLWHRLCAICVNLLRRLRAPGFMVSPSCDSCESIMAPSCDLICSLTLMMYFGIEIHVLPNRKASPLPSTIRLVKPASMN